MSMDRLIKKIRAANNPTVVGLDPRMEYIPSFIKKKCFDEFGITTEGVRSVLFSFNKALIDALWDIVPAVKPQSAYYEMYGLGGMVALKDTIAYARDKGMYVILDVKRNDIGSTAEAYSAAYLSGVQIDGQPYAQDFPADSITVNPYLGSDGIAPFIRDCNTHKKSIFALVKTSNPSSGELQDIAMANGRTLYEHVAELVDCWGAQSVGKNGYSNVGAVVGATYPEQLQTLRAKMPHTYFLVPGYGAQGGTAQDVAKAFDADGLGAVVNSSRGIICAYQKMDYDEHDFAAAARAEAIRMRDDIIQYL